MDSEGQENKTMFNKVSLHWSWNMAVGTLTLAPFISDVSSDSFALPHIDLAIN